MEWLSEKHLAYFILDVVGEIDHGQIEEAIQQKDARGERPYAPGMMTALLFYGYCVGEYSSRRIARATFEDVAFRMIAGEEHPHFTRINQFRLDHGESLGGLFVEVLLMCQRAGLVKMGHVALDGTKIKAAAGKHKAMSYKRMNKDEARLQGEVEEMLRRADLMMSHCRIMSASVREREQKKPNKRPLRLPPRQRRTVMRGRRTRRNCLSGKRSGWQAEAGGATQLHRSRKLHHGQGRGGTSKPTTHRSSWMMPIKGSSRTG
jgi:transposase